MIRSIFAISAVLVILGLTALINFLPTPQPITEDSGDGKTNSLFINDIGVFDGQQTLSTQDVEIIDGIISRVGENLSPANGLPMLEGSGMTLMPGLIDAHTHSYFNALTDTLRFGVTTHLDMFTTEQGLLESVAKRKSLAQTDQADLFSSGTMATVEKGHGTQYGFPIDTIDDAQEVAQWIKQRKDAGADYIKLVYMPYQDRIPSLEKQTASAIIVEAKKQQLMVLAHISKYSAAKDMIEAGVDGLVHIFADKLVDDELILLAQKKQVFIIPTLSVIASVNGTGNQRALLASEGVEALLSGQQKSSLQGSFGQNIPGYDLDIAKQNVKRFFDAGVPILAGSDAPNPGTAYGISTHGELQLLVDAGLSSKQALVAATSLPAKHFQLNDRGHIKPGLRADFLLLSEDPSQAIQNTLSIKAIYKNGFEVSRKLAEETENVAAASSTLGDFEAPNKEALQSQGSLMWSHTDDSVANGKSSAQIQVLSTDDGKTVLQVQGEVKAGFPYPWSGAAVGDFVPPISALDISNFTHIAFDVRGKPGMYRVMVFDTVNQGVPPYQMFEISSQWQEVKIEISQFSGFQANAFSGLSLVAGPELGKFEFAIDNVRFE